MSNSITFDIKDLEEVLKDLAVNKETNSKDREFKIYYASEAGMKMFEEAVKKEVEKNKK